MACDKDRHVASANPLSSIWRDKSKRSNSGQKCATTLKIGPSPLEDGINWLNRTPSLHIYINITPSINLHFATSSDYHVIAGMKTGWDCSYLWTALMPASKEAAYAAEWSLREPSLSVSSCTEDPQCTWERERQRWSNEGPDWHEMQCRTTSNKEEKSPTSVSIAAWVGFSNLSRAEFTSILLVTVESTRPTAHITSSSSCKDNWTAWTSCKPIKTL